MIKYTFLFLLLALFSCGTANNFQKQKYTDFRTNRHSNIKVLKSPVKENDETSVTISTLVNRKEMQELVQPNQAKTEELVMDNMDKILPESGEMDVFSHKVVVESIESFNPRRIQTDKSTNGNLKRKDKTQGKNRIPNLQKAFKISAWASIFAGIALLILFLLQLDFALFLAFAFAILVLTTLTLLLQIPIWRKIEKLETDGQSNNSKPILWHKALAVFAAMAPFLLVGLGFWIALIILL